MKPQVAVSNEIKIDSGVPLAKVQGIHTIGRAPEFPFAIMEVGQSFFVKKTIYQVSNAKRYHEMNHGGIFKCRTVTEGGVKGCRVWRIA